MLTGDNQATAQRVAGQLSVNTVIVEVLPGDKAGKIADLQRSGTKVAMVAMVSTTHPPWPRPTSGSPSAPGPTSPSRPST
jgi:high-affinity K+ transport system ATPase subunit B